MAEYIYAKQEELERLNYYGKKDIVPTDSNYFKFTVNDDGVTATVDLASTDIQNLASLVIPYKCTINNVNYIVTHIENTAYVEPRKATEIIIPNTIISIGAYAFNYCIELKELVIPKSVKVLKTYAFGNSVLLSKLICLADIEIIERDSFFDMGIGVSDVQVICPQDSNIIEELAGASVTFHYSSVADVQTKNLILTIISHKTDDNGDIIVTVDHTPTEAHKAWLAGRSLNAVSTGSHPDYGPMDWIFNIWGVSDKYIIFSYFTDPANGLLLAGSIDDDVWKFKILAAQEE